MEKIQIKRFIISIGLFFLVLLSTGLCNADDLPLENQCQPYIEKAINELKKENVEVTSLEEETTFNSEQNSDSPLQETNEITSKEEVVEENSIENKSEISVDDSIAKNLSEELDNNENSKDEENTEQKETEEAIEGSTENVEDLEESSGNDEKSNEDKNERSKREVSEGEETAETVDNEDSEAATHENDTEEQLEQTSAEETQQTQKEISDTDAENTSIGNESANNEETSQEEIKSSVEETQETLKSSVEETQETLKSSDEETQETLKSSDEATQETNEEELSGTKSIEEEEKEEPTVENVSKEQQPDDTSENNENTEAEKSEVDKTEEVANSLEISSKENTDTNEDQENNDSAPVINEVDSQGDENLPNPSESTETKSEDDEESTIEESLTKQQSNGDEQNTAEEKSAEELASNLENLNEENTHTNEDNSNTNEEEQESTDSEANKNEDDDHPEDDLLLEFEIPKNLRDRTHIAEILHLDDRSSNTEIAVNKASDIILRDLKRIYDNAIKPLETVYKYRDLSNRHFGDPEIFSKPLVLFMGPWSGGKSTILNYLSENEYTPHSIRSGAEPSPAYFNILMYGDEPEVLDGTQLAADWTFSGLQKFGQGMLDRLRGVKLPNKLLKKVNIVEIPGILEVRKQVSRLFPFNDACQWFIDRADIIFLVYDPSKLDVGPETEAILDQLKGREYQTRILLNKADTVKPEELLRVQSALIWNISPLMSSAHPPVLYTVSLWSHPYREGAPIRLLQAQERALLKDLQEAIEKRIENKIASARRFAVRIRNHAKMVDCYLTTYYNHKTLFANKKQISDHIIENPSHYHIYEGLSTLTNISRYDLPNEDAYRDFFKLNPLYNFKRLAETCTYFRGCPINQLDIAISYQLPELAGKYKKILEQELLKIEGEHKGE